MFPTKIAVTLKGHHCNRWPNVSVGIDDYLLIKTPLIGTKTYSIDHCLDVGNHELWIRMQDKTNHDTTVEADQAVEISSVTIEEMTSDGFRFKGIYQPDYPEPWASQQEHLPSELIGVSYLGWNGIWKLQFSVPIFRWIHETDHLGWIYD